MNGVLDNGLCFEYSFDIGYCPGYRIMLWTLDTALSLDNALDTVHEILNGSTIYCLVVMDNAMNIVWYFWILLGISDKAVDIGCHLPL